MCGDNVILISGTCRELESQWTSHDTLSQSSHQFRHSILRIGWTMRISVIAVAVTALDFARDALLFRVVRTSRVSVEFISQRQLMSCDTAPQKLIRGVSPHRTLHLLSLKKVE
jgi:hypothetical protein